MIDKAATTSSPKSFREHKNYHEAEFPITENGPVQKVSQKGSLGIIGLKISGCLAWGVFHLDNIPMQYNANFHGPFLFSLLSEIVSTL